MLTYDNLSSRNDFSIVVADEDDSWEVRAFAKDRSSTMGTIWPPRFYSCTFCRREFRSAQALGGHMNVHRRDRARMQLLHTQPPSRGPCPTSKVGSLGLHRVSSTINFDAHSCIYEDSCLLEKVGLFRKSGESGKEDEDLVVQDLDLELRL